MNRRTPACCALLLTAWLTGVQAQTIEPSTAVDAAGQIARLIDDGRTAEVWEGASTTARQIVGKDRFVAEVAASRQARGAAASRQWQGITRREAPDSTALPAGLYLTVEFLTRFASGPPATEWVSFRLDADQIWRVTGYALK
jgi:hypothetical protein